MGAEAVKPTVEAGGLPLGQICADGPGMAFVDEKGAVDLGINEGVSASPWRTVQLEEGMEPITPLYRS